MKKSTSSQVARNARNAAAQGNELTKLARRLDSRYEKNATTFNAVSAGRNQVQINGSLYPAEGVDGQGGAFTVVNVGTPSVAKYAPAQRRSVVAVTGTGGGSGGGGGGTPPDGGGGSGMIVHDLDGSWHSGILSWGKVSKSGSSLADLSTRNHSALAFGTDDHHAKVHPLVGPEHTASGLTPGYAVIATSPTTFAWGQMKHTDLDPASVLPDQHHAKVHNIIGPDHVATAPAFSIVGTVATNVLGYLTATHDPGPTERLLKTNADGSLFLDTNLLYVDALYNRVAINRATAIAPESGAALDVVVGTNLNDHTQRIKQKDGQLGRLWRIENTEGDELIVLDSVGNLQSGRPGFYSGLTGWQVTPQGNAEFNNIWARGELHATVFVKDEVHATGGTLLVATAATVHADAEIDSAAVDSDTFEVVSDATAFPGLGELPLTIETTVEGFGTTLTTEGIGNIILINDPPSGPALYFTPGEIIRVKTEVETGVTDFWFVVQNAVLVAADEELGIEGHNRLSVTHKSGGGPTQSGMIPKGAALVSYGHPGDGRILLTSDWQTNRGTNGVGDDSYAPYIDVFNIGTEPWTGNAGEIIPRMRMGQLKGVGVPGVSGISQWGMIAGSDLTNANAGYMIASNLGIRMYKVPLRLNNGNADTGLWTAEGNLRIGKDVSQDNTTGFRVFTTGGEDYEGNVIIGNETTGNFLRWHQKSGTLTVSGSLVVQDPGTTVTKKYVDDQDTAYLGFAKTYVNDRRIVKVTGTWTSPAANTIGWDTIQLHTSVGTIYYPTTGSWNFSQRTYLYYNLNQGFYGNFSPVTAGELVTDPTWVLVAVLDPPAAGSGTDKASVTVVAGGTYISGGNIWTGSVHADRLVSNSITTNQMAATSINLINATPIAHGDARRVIGVSGTWGYGAINSNTVTWTSGLTVRFGNGTSKSVSPGQVTVTTTFTYMAVDVTQATLTLTPFNSIASMTANHALIAVIRAAANYLTGGSGYPSVEIAAGGTFISGDAIITGSIVAQNIAALTINAGHIAADTITANKMNVDDLNAMTVNASNPGRKLSISGPVELGTSGTPGQIYSLSKSSYGNNTAGFFLGYDGGYFRFNIGDANNWLKWDGANLLLRTVNAIEIKANASAQLFKLQDFTYNVETYFTFYYDPSTGIQIGLPGTVTANRFIAQSEMRSPLFTSVKSGGEWQEVMGFENTSGFARRGIGYEAVNGAMSFPGDTHTGGSIFGQALILTGSLLRVGGSAAPAGGSGGATGDMRWSWDGTNAYLYVCVQANMWRRTPLINF